MSAPISILPLPENDSRPARPVYYQTKSSAERSAVKRAMALSSDGLARPVEFVCDVYQGGERFFAVRTAAPSDDFVVRELSASEVERLQQAGIRAAIERCGHEIESHERDASNAKPGSCFERVHRERVAQVRERMRVLGLRIIVGAVQP